MPLPKLVYFSSRGRAEVIRLALAEAAVPHEEERFPNDAFAALKASGRLPFMAVPVWEEDGLRLAQSGAILNHVGRAHGLRGSSPRDEALVDQALGAVDDVRAELRKLPGAEASKRPEVRAELQSATLPRWFGMLEKLLVANHGGDGFIAGAQLSVADLALWYLLELTVDNGFAAALADCPKLQAFAKRIAARPRIAAYLASPQRPPLQKFPG
jgi:glutathione S-transferase